MRKALLVIGLVGLFAALTAAAPSSPPQVQELAFANFPAVTVDDLVEGAQPRTSPIPHVSPERFENSLLVVSGSDGGTLTIDGAKVPVMHTLPDAGVSPQAIETNTVTLSSGTLTYTFGTAFGGIPICVCSDTASTAAACSCNATTASQTVIKGGTSAVVNVICVGKR